MQRRTFLALSGSSIAGLAGCLSESPSSGTDPATETEATATDRLTTASTTEDSTTESDDSSPTETTVNATVSVNTDALQPGLVTMNTPDSIGVKETAKQYLVLQISAEGTTLPTRDDFEFEFAGADFQPISSGPGRRIWRFYGEEGKLYDADSGQGFVLFELPETNNVADASDSSEIALMWPGGEWRPDESLRERLVTPSPPLSVSVDIPDAIRTDEQPTVTITVQNEGDVAGRFVAGLNRVGPYVAHRPVARISMLVPAGETETWELRDDSIMAGDYSEEDVNDGEPDIRYYLSWPNKSKDWSVRYID